MLCGHLYLNLIIVIVRKTSFFPLNAIVGKLNVGVIFVFFKEQLAVFKLIICSEKRSLGAPEDIEVTLNNYVRSFSVSYSLFSTVRKRHFPCFTPH